MTAARVSEGSGLCCDTARPGALRLCVGDVADVDVEVDSQLAEAVLLQDVTLSLSLLQEMSGEAPACHVCLSIRLDRWLPAATDPPLCRDPLSPAAAARCTAQLLVAGDQRARTPCLSTAG
jgi:hypothetical protein